MNSMARVDLKALSRRRFLQASAAASLALGFWPRTGRNSPGDDFQPRFRGHNPQYADGGRARNDDHRGDAARFHREDRHHHQFRESCLPGHAREACAPTRGRTRQRLIRCTRSRFLLGLRVRPLRMGRGFGRAHRRLERPGRSGAVHSRAAQYRFNGRWQDLLHPDFSLPDGADLPQRSPRRRSVPGRLQGRRPARNWLCPRASKTMWRWPRRCHRSTWALRRGDASAAGRPDRDGVLQLPLRPGWRVSTTPR